MENEKYILKELANKLFEFFIINRNAMAIQMPDGNYVTKYTNVTENDIFYMLSEKKAIGSYQQLYKSPYLKWICFDFDCKDKENPDLVDLYNNCTLPLINYLNNLNIYYINEFSGRRGIHTWILFNKFITKQEGFEILQTIKKNVNWNYDEKKYGLDEFPATYSSKGNILGKQVKVPLSFHKKGTRSFLFEGNYKSSFENENFYINQLNILNNVQLNEIDKIKEKLGICIKQNDSIFKKTYISEEIQCSAEDVISILSETKVYKEIFDRTIHGEMLPKDWLVMLGTLGKLNDGYKLLIDIFKYCPTFSETETFDKINKYGNKYYPATFSYLYKLYDLEMETEIISTETGLQYLIKKLNLDIEIKEFNQNEKEILLESKYTLIKEKKYLFTNDEVPVVSIYHDLCHMTSYDTKKIDDTLNRIKNGEKIHLHPKDYCIFKRIENENKTRTMVSLSAYDRVLTSHMALNLFYDIEQSIKSYSYNPNFISTDEIFFHWYPSWRNYLSQIRKYIEVDFYKNLNVIVLDIKHFYDSIDFLGAYNLLNKTLSKENNNLFLELISFNEKLMKEIKNSRKGVPQGPAYARIIAESFLGTIIQKILDKFPNKNLLHVYRYVDDIIIFHDQKIDSTSIYQTFETIFNTYGLILNKEKSKIYGTIANLTEKQKAEIMRYNQFQYGLRNSEYSYLFENDYVNEKAKQLIEKKGGFNISDLSLYFSNYLDDRAKDIFFEYFSKEIFTSNLGRGSGYQLFYKYILKKQNILKKCLSNQYFSQVPLNSINFSCLLAEIYYSFENNTISIDNQQNIIKTFISKINIQKIERREDKSIICSLSRLK